MSDFVIIRDMSAGNASVGEMWQETAIFPSTATLLEVMEWAENEGGIKGTCSRKRIQITRPDSAAIGAGVSKKARARQGDWAGSWGCSGVAAGERAD